MSWEEALHPRDEYGRFRLRGLTGRWRPHANGETFTDARGRTFDYETGYMLDTNAMRGGWMRVGDLPAGVADQAPGGRRRPGDLSSGGAWHKPGEYGPGHVPILRTEYGTPLSSLQPEDTKTLKFRRSTGTSFRHEVLAEILNRRTHDRLVITNPSEAAPEVRGSHLSSPLNPVGRRRAAKQRSKRRNSTTWIQRLNNQIEGR